MKDMLKKSMRDLLGRNASIEDWQVILFYFSITAIAILVFTISG